MLGHAQSGAFLIRVGDLLRHGELQPHIDAMNREFGRVLCELMGSPTDNVDLREIEWIAGGLLFSVKPAKGPGTQNQFMFGSGRIVVRAARAADWQAITLRDVAGSSLETFQGQSYVKFPMLPALGPAPLYVRFPNDRTMVYQVGVKGSDKDAAIEAKFLKGFFDDTPRLGPWAAAWRAVDGGLVTLAFDNSTVGWRDVRQDAFPKCAATLVNQTKFVAIGLDWSASNRTGVRIRATCDAESVKDLQLAALTGLSHWPVLFVDGGDVTAKYHKRILQFFSSMSVEASDPAGGEHYVQATADVGWTSGELAEVLNNLWRLSVN